MEGCLVSFNLKETRSMFLLYLHSPLFDSFTLSFKLFIFALPPKTGCLGWDSSPAYRFHINY